MVGAERNNYMYMYFQVMIYRFVTRNSVEERVCEVRVGGASTTCTCKCMHQEHRELFYF